MFMMRWKGRKGPFLDVYDEIELIKGPFLDVHDEMKRIIGPIP
jgi:hypothetical protein